MNLNFTKISESIQKDTYQEGIYTNVQSLYITFYLLDSALFNRARSISSGTMWPSKNDADASRPRRRVSTLYAALGYACIQIRQRGGRICRINSAGGGGREPARSL